MSTFAQPYTPFTALQITKEPTGFAQPDDVVITANGDRTVTLTGTVNAYYKGVKSDVLISGYTSPAHGTNTSSLYFLTYNGTNIDWRDLTADSLDFEDILICYAFYDSTASAWIYFHESHGLMPWQTHGHLHSTVGTFKVSGGDVTATLSSTTAADRRPTVAQTVIQDEDVKTTLPALSTASFTQASNTGAGAFTFALAQGDVVALSGNNPYYNSFSSPNWGQTLMPTDSVATVWLLALPVTADASSQAYRYCWIQPQWITQAQNSSPGALATAREAEENRQPSELNLTTLTTFAPEFIEIARLTIQYTSGNWTIETVSILDGTRYNQIGLPGGDYLSVVVSDTTQFSGDGTGASPLTLETAAFGTIAPTTTKGDLIVSDGSDNIRLAVGTNDHVLTADSGETAGVKWASATSMSSLPQDYIAGLQLEYVDASSVKVLAGECRSADDTTDLVLSSDTTIDLTTDLDTGSEADSTNYYVWIGTVTGTVTVKFSASASSPTGLTTPRRLPGVVANRVGASNNDIAEFVQYGDWQEYLYDIDCDGTDTTSVLDASVGTTAVTVDCSAWVPAEVVSDLACRAGSSFIYLRRYGDTPWVYAGYDGNGGNIYYYPVLLDSSARAEIKTDGAVTTRVSVRRFKTC